MRGGQEMDCTVGNIARRGRAERASLRERRLVSVRRYLTFVLLMSGTVWAQVRSPVNPTPSRGTARMATPPPISIDAYPIEVGSEVRSNYLSGGVTVKAAYIDNLYPGTGVSLHEKTYTILPTISLDQTTARQHRAFIFSPGFTLYRPTSDLDQTDLGAILRYQYRLAPHATISIRDSFTKSSTSFGGAESFAQGTVSGTLPSTVPGIISPFAERLTNSAAAQLTFQFSRDGMIGASGKFLKLHYPNPEQVSGLYDSDERGGSAFYNRRIFGSQYIGAYYRYAKVFAYPENADSETQTQTAYAFYTIYPKHGFSISFAAGPQYYDVVQTSLATAKEWEPVATASIGWRGSKTSFAAGYAREIAAGGGLLGAYRSNSADASARWRVLRRWTVGASSNYAINKSVGPRLPGAFQGGHSVSGSATVEHSIGRQLNLQFQYDRLHRSYNGVLTGSNNPDSNRGVVSLSWNFSRPLGR